MGEQDRYANDYLLNMGALFDSPDKGCYTSQTNSEAGGSRRLMMNFRLHTAVAAVCLFMLFSDSDRSRLVSAPAEIQWLRSLAAARTQATSEHKMIIADLVADWCGWCKVMDTDTWQNPSVVGESSKYIFLKLDTEKDADGVALTRKFGITGLPTIMILTAAGEEFERLEGYLPAQEFLGQLKAALAAPDSLGNLRIAVKGTPDDLALRFKLADKLFERSSYREAEEHLAWIVQKDPANKSKSADLSLFYLAVCKSERADTDGCLADLNRLRKDFPDSNVVPATFVLAGQMLIRTGKKTEAREQLEQFLKKYPNHPLVGRAQAYLDQIK